MAGQVAIEEKAIKVATNEMERVDEFQQVDMEVEEPVEGEWISVEGMDDAVNCNDEEMVKLLDELQDPGIEVKAVNAPGDTD